MVLAAETKTKLLGFSGSKREGFRRILRHPASLKAQKVTFVTKEHWEKYPTTICYRMKEPKTSGFGQIM